MKFFPASKKSSEPTDSALHFVQRVPARIFRNVASFKSKAQSLHGSWPSITTWRTESMTRNRLHALPFIPCFTMVTPEFVPFNEPLKKTPQAVGTLWDNDAMARIALMNVFKRPFPSTHRKIHHDSGNIKIIATFPVGLISSQTNIGSTRQVLGKPRGVWFNFQQTGTPSLTPIRESILLFDQSLEASANNRSQWLSKNLTYLPPVGEHFRRLVASGSAHVNVISWLDFGQVKRHCCTVFSTAKSYYVEHASPSSASGVSSVSNPALESLPGQPRKRHEPRAHQA